MSPKKSPEQKKQEALEQLAQPLPGIPDRHQNPPDLLPPPPAEKGEPTGPKVDWNGAPPGTVTVLGEPVPRPRVEKKPRKPRAPKAEKPPRKKAQGKYGVFVGGRVTGADQQIVEVLVPVPLGVYGSRAEAQKCALETATRKAGVVVEVHRLLDKFVLQEVTKVTLVKS